jgi:NADH-quinone oxidoreductase subunit M
MKLGGYGCLRVATYLMPDAAHHYSPVIILLPLAIIWERLQPDAERSKYINASLHVGGLYCCQYGMLTQTYNRCRIAMVSHGLMTALFLHHRHDIQQPVRLQSNWEVC